MSVLVSDPVRAGETAIPASSKEAQVQTLPVLEYPIPSGCHAIPAEELDLRPDAEIDEDIVNPKPISTEWQKNIFFFWHSGYETMHPYTKRNVRAHYRRLAKKGWNIYVINRVEGSPLNIAEFVDVTDPELFPKAYIDGRVGGEFAPQHTSDLVRWPLLRKYGVGHHLLQLGSRGPPRSRQLLLRLAAQQPALLARTQAVVGAVER
ncbi:hypothetical protein NPX13_g10891 [Xylaria arbuscula]|uniref:Uncharacterized protein n=1 Tax=Xylaria arbuscula TaxID=114810 RepID=A0A9W8N3Z2_9PEZI|nr:hypothetical protein NPX13_g10891 [Xylaria arbuscula]